MTPAELRDWMKRRGLTHAKAAELLCMSIQGLQKNLYGRYPIGARTAKIIELYDTIVTIQTANNSRPSE